MISEIPNNIVGYFHIYTKRTDTYYGKDIKIKTDRTS